MNGKKFISLLIACFLVVGCLTMPVGAAAVASGSSTQAIARATGQILESISAKTIMALGTVSLNIGETVSYNCTYVSSSASLDFGFIAPDGLFYSVNSTTGSINTIIHVNQRGVFTLAIRNNSNSTVTVTGTVNY